MSTIIAFVLGLFFGGSFGFIVCGVLTAEERNDDDG